MRDENKRKLGEQLIKCILDDKLDKDVKLRKIDYIVKMGADVNVRHEFGYSALGLAQAMKDEEIISFLEGKGAEDIGFDKEKTQNFFRTASVEEMNGILKMLPDGFMLDCDVDLSRRDLTKLPDFSRIVVNGEFDCFNNQLITLNGAPREVGGTFHCTDNKLITLVGAPSKVDGCFYCEGNKLESLEGAPREVGLKFYCSYNELKTLKGAPRVVGRSFNCTHNKLTTLEGAPREVGGHFDCSDNPLKSYKGKPDKIDWNFLAPDIKLGRKIYNILTRGGDRNER